MEKAFLVLEDGQVLEGVSCGAPGSVRGELVFTTEMTDSARVSTDPAFGEKLLVFTFPQVGNCGVTEDLMESTCPLKGLVVRELCKRPSNYACLQDLDSFLKDRGVVGIEGVDTRYLTQLLRDYGGMMAEITTTAPASHTIKESR